MRFNNDKGFTIVEMAIVVVVFGLLLAIGFKMLIPLSDRMKESKSNQIIEAARESVIGYAQTYGRLPTDVEFKTVVKNNKDVWGKDLIYRPAPELITAGSICSQSTTFTTVNVCDDGTCAAPIDTAENTAFFIMSSGANMNVQTLVPDVAFTSATINTYTRDLPNIDKNTSDMNRPEAYKDNVKWVVLPELRAELNCEGPPLKILDTPLPSGVEESGYNADIFATGGVPWDDAAPPAGDDDTAGDFEWCVTEALPLGLKYYCPFHESPGTPIELLPSASCSIDPAAGTWQRCSSIRISGVPSTGGSFYLPVFVRDDVDNIDSQAFSLSITPFSGLKVCTQYRVWNRTSGNNRGFQVRLGYDVVLPDPIVVGAECAEFAENDEVFFPGKEPNNTIIIYEVLEMYTSGPGVICNGLVSRLSFNNAILADTDGDCCVNFDFNRPNSQVYDADCP